VRKLIQGILRFREERRSGYAAAFRELALAQKPDALFIACSDSRMAVNVFASTDPGDLFVVRNVGNLVPPFGSAGGAGTVAAVDFALENLGVRDIIVCGHSDCGAMKSHRAGHEELPPGALREWLDLGATGEKGASVDEASRVNVLEQLEHLRGYPSVKEAITRAGLRLHGLWFDIHTMDVWYHEPDLATWTVLDAVEGKRILDRMER
jgi:carbonic anhydrase